MRITLVGVGIAGVISTIMFGVFPLDGFQMESSDLLETLVLLGMTFGSVLFVGFVSRPSRHKHLSHRESQRGVSHGSEWCMRCPRCRKVVSRRTMFCPDCGANMNNAQKTYMPSG